MLDKIKGPEDVKALSKDELPKLAEAIRERIIRVTASNGGHIGPNLGVVELTIALHRVFNTPKDRFIFDVSHQGYVHKLLTGRNDERFDKIRQSHGLSGFLMREESEHDCYGAGHAGTALSAALGMASGRDHKQSDEEIVAVLGDAALTCGITLEALNNVTQATKRMIIILNDNEWSIDKNVGAISHYLNELLTNPIYNRLQEDFHTLLDRVPGGETLSRSLSKAKMEAKDLLVPSSLFEHLGIRYIGPVDGHDLDQLEHYLNFCKNSESPVILHVITKKGKGYENAINNPEKFHGTGAFNIKTGKSEPAQADTAPKYQDVFGSTMVRFAQKDKSIIGITGAMPSGTGLSDLRDQLPDQYRDVGIAEEHAVLYAAGLATQGLKPVCAIYSTFLQRGVDPIIHDVCLQQLPVLFCMDRAGLSPQDGPTHHGLFDISLYRPVPHAILMQPKDEDELVDMMHTGLESGRPAFIRYPRGKGEGTPIKEEPSTLEIGKAEVLRKGNDLAIWAYGPFAYQALAIAETLEKEDGISASVVNGRFAKPLDNSLLKQHCEEHSMIVTMEDHVITGGFGSAVLEASNDMGQNTPVIRIGWPDAFQPHASSDKELRAANGLSTDGMLKTIRNALKHRFVKA